MRSCGEVGLECQGSAKGRIRRGELDAAFRPRQTGGIVRADRVDAQERR